MPLFNFLETFVQLDVAKYIMVAFAFYGTNLAVRKTITHKGL